MKPSRFRPSIDFWVSSRRMTRLCESSWRTIGLSGASWPAFLATASASGNRWASTSELYSSTSIARRWSTSTFWDFSRVTRASTWALFRSISSSPRRLPVDSSMSRRARSIRCWSWFRTFSGTAGSAILAAASSSRARASAGDRCAVRRASSCLAATSAEIRATSRSSGMAAAPLSADGRAAFGRAFSTDLDSASSMTRLAAAASSLAAGSSSVPGSTARIARVPARAIHRQARPIAATIPPLPVRAGEDDRVGVSAIKTFARAMDAASCAQDRFRRRGEVAVCGKSGQGHVSLERLPSLSRTPPPQREAFFCGAATRTVPPEWGNASLRGPVLGPRRIRRLRRRGRESGRALSRRCRAAGPRGTV